MNQDKFYINNQLVEINESLVIPITYSIADYRNPQQRKRSSSGTVEIPGTIPNKRIFSSAYNLSLTDTGDQLGFDLDPSVRIPARYIKNGKEIFNGLARLLEVKIKDGNYTFEVVLFSDFVNIIKQLGDIMVGELDWSEYDHALNLTNVQNSWSTSIKVNGVDTTNYTLGKPDGFGYWYPIIDYGYNSSLLTFELNDLVPHVYFREIFTKAFGDLGYTIESDFFDSDMFRALVFGFGGGEKEMLPPVDVTDRRTQYDFDGLLTRTGGSSILWGPDPTTGVATYFFTAGGLFGLNNFSETLTTDNYSQYNNTTGKIKVQQSGTYNLNLNYSYDIRGFFSDAGVSSSSRVQSRLEVWKNGSRIGFTPWSYVNTGSSWNNVTGNKDFSLSLSSGDEVEVKVWIYVNGTASHTSNFSFTTELDYSTVSVDLTSTNSIYLEGDTITISRFLPQTKVAEFILGVINTFNLYIDDADEDGIIKIEPLNEFYFDISEQEVWTDILDYSKEISIKSPSLNAAKTYSFMFEEEKDFYQAKYRDNFGKGYGDYVYESNNEYNTKKTVYKIPFSQTCPVEITPGYVIPRIVSIDSVTNIVSPYKGKAKFYFNNGLKNGSFSIRTASGINSFTQYPQAHHSYGHIAYPSFDANFEKPEEVYYVYNRFKNSNLFENYHRINIEELTSIDAKVLKAFFKLNDNYINTKMFRRFVNINGVLYKKNIINEYDATGNETTQVELLKVLETTENSSGGGGDIPDPRVISRIPERGRVILIGANPRLDPRTVLEGGGVINGGRNTAMEEAPVMLQLRAIAEPTLEPE